MARFVSLIALAAALAVPAFAQAADKPAEKAAEAASQASGTPNRVVVKRSGTFGGVKMNYTAVVGETFL